MTAIERVETVALRVPLDHVYRGSYYKMRNRCTILTTVRTSGGLTGRAYNADSDEEQAEIIQIIEEIAPLVTGIDILSVERCWQAMLPVTLDQLRDRRLAMQAIACVDTAIWDAVGQALGQPLWRLWGGYRSSITMIGIGGYYGDDDRAIIENDIAFFVGEHRMKGMKFKIGGRPPEIDAQRLAHARSLVDDQFSFIVDANQGYTVAEALEFLRLVPDDVQLRWFEEPTRWHSDFRGLRDVRLKGGVPVAAGQSEISRVGMRELIINGAIDVSNFDASWGGGPTEWRRLAAMALAFDIDLGHHEEGHLAAHLLASVPNGTFVEAFTPQRDPIFWNLLSNRKPLEDGQLPLPEGPGLGWTLDEDFIQRYRVDG